MKTVTQRVAHASVTIDGTLKSKIGKGLLILVGIEDRDTQEDIEWLAKKITNLRIFDDENGVMNLPITAVGGRVLAISQFTLTASTRRGNRPSYIRAARGDEARALYRHYCDHLATLLSAAETDRAKDSAARHQSMVEQGIFGADMAVSLTNDGPVTIIIDSRLKE